MQPSPSLAPNVNVAREPARVLRPLRLVVQRGVDGDARLDQRRVVVREGRALALAGVDEDGVLVVEELLRRVLRLVLVVRAGAHLVAAAVRRGEPDAVLVQAGGLRAREVLGCL